MLEQLRDGGDNGAYPERSEVSESKHKRYLFWRLSTMLLIDSCSLPLGIKKIR